MEKGEEIRDRRVFWERSCAFAECQHQFGRIFGKLLICSGQGYLKDVGRRQDFLQSGIFRCKKCWDSIRNGLYSFGLSFGGTLDAY